MNINKYLNEPKSNVCPVCNTDIRINDCHSQISEFPIDLESFPLVKNCIMHKVVLTKNQYLFMPKNWFHWVFTEPNTLSIHYKINNISFGNKNDNDIYGSLKNNLPFYKQNFLEFNIDYKKFIANSLDHSYRAIFSKTDDCIPVQKNNAIKFFHSNTLANLIAISKKKNYHTYIGNQEIDSDNILNKFSNINNIIDSNFYDNISYEPSVWFTLDKKVNSGLHCDITPNLMYVIEGKKIIYLFAPSCYPNLYINEYQLIKNI